MRRLWMILLVLVIPLTASGLVQFIPPGGGGSGGGGGAQAPSFTVATRPTGVPVGTVIAVIDGTNAQDCAVGGGTSVVQCRWNGSAWLAFGDGSTAGSGGAPDNAPYVTLAPAAGLLAEQALSLLGSGLLLNTTGTGVPTIYAGSGAPANQFVRSLSPSGVATFAGVAETDLLFAVATQAELDAVQALGAPLSAPFVTTTPVAGLPAEQALSTLTTGLLRNTTGTGVPTIYPGTTCPNGFPRSLNPEGGADCQSVAEADLTFAAATQPELDAVQVGLQGQIDVVTAAQLGYYVKTLQTLSEGGTIDCAPPPGQFIGAIVRVEGDGLLTALGLPQIAPGVVNTQFCLLLGMDDAAPVPIVDGGGVQLAQAQSEVRLDSRGSLLTQWDGTSWRQVDQFGVIAPGAGEAQGLQANCEVNCELGPLSEAQPLIIAPADDPGTPEIEGPQEHIFSPDGNFYRVRYSAPGVLAAPLPLVLEPNTCWPVQAVQGTPLAEVTVGALCNDGMVTTTAGIFDRPHADEVPIVAVEGLTASNVQEALAQLAAQQSSGSGAPSATRLGLHQTAEEVAIWQQRRTQAPYDAEYTVILDLANTWVATPDARWAGQPASTCWAAATDTPPNRNHDAGMMDAAFVYLLTGTVSYKDAVVTQLLAQAATPGTNFADTTRWCIPQDGITTFAVDILPWMMHLVHAYSYLQSSMTVAQQDTINTWLLGAAIWTRNAMQVNIAKRFPGRLNNDYSAASCTNGTFCPGASFGLTAFGGPEVFSFHTSWSNQGSAAALFVAEVGVLVGDQPSIEHAKRYVREWLRYGVFPGGMLVDQYRWNDGGGTPQHGYLYTGVSVGSVLSIAESLCRIGECEPYTYATTEGLYGTASSTPKTLLSALQHFAALTLGTTVEYASTTSTSDPLLRIDPLGPSQTRVEYVNLAPNQYYRDASVRQAYSTAIPASPDHGGYDPLAGAWGNYPRIRFMFADLEGVVWPYLAEPLPLLPPWHLPWSAAGALVDGTTCVTQAKALVNAGPSVVSVVCADAATGTIEFSFDTPGRYTGGAVQICTEINDPVAAASVWAASIIAQWRGSGQVVDNTWSSPVVASATLTTAHAGYFACASVTPNGAAAGIGRVFIKATMDAAGLHTDSNGRVLGGYVSGP